MVPAAPCNVAAVSTAAVTTADCCYSSDAHKQIGAASSTAYIIQTLQQLLCSYTSFKASVVEPEL
jgi:hypothetical protein